jgi:hypothetical protein
MNIDTWKTKKLDNLQIPIEWFYNHKRKDYHARRPSLNEDGSFFIDLIDNSNLTGFIENETIFVTKINFAGEGSGTLYGAVLFPALEHSKGYLEAVLHWEGGEIERIIVNDGKIKHENIDL